MYSLLIVLGLLLIGSGFIWLTLLAFGTSLLWGVASLVPGLNLWYASQHWARVRRSMLLAALGVIPFVVGLSVLASKDMEHFQDLLTLHWSGSPKPLANGQLINVHGTLAGQNFNPTQAEVINGVLILREGREFFARRELRIELGTQPAKPIRWDILPGDVGAMPAVEINWRMPDQTLAEARRLTHGYSLHIDLKPLAPNKMTGDIYLALPQQLQTVISGNVQLFTNHLRYTESGSVDRHIDTRDTLTYVINDYLQRRWETTDVQLQPLPMLKVTTEHIEIPIALRVQGRVEAQTVSLNKTAAVGWQVIDDHYPALPKPTVEAATTAPVADAPTPVPPPKNVDFSLAKLQKDPASYRDSLLHIETKSGATTEGRFLEIDPQGALVIQQVRNGQGGASFNILPATILDIRLIQP